MVDQSYERWCQKGGNGHIGQWDEDHDANRPLSKQGRLPEQRPNEEDEDDPYQGEHPDPQGDRHPSQLARSLVRMAMKATVV